MKAIVARAYRRAPRLRGDADIPRSVSSMIRVSDRPSISESSTSSAPFSDSPICRSRARSNFRPAAEPCASANRRSARRCTQSFLFDGFGFILSFRPAPVAELGVRRPDPCEPGRHLCYRGRHSSTRFIATGGVGALVPQQSVGLNSSGESDILFTARCR